MIFACVSVYANLDMDAYKRYKKTKLYQTAAAKPKGALYTNMYARYSKKDNMLYWGLTLSKIEDLTGSWADTGAIAKANHKNFIYILLTPVLKGSHGEEISRGIEIQRKMMFGKENKVSFATPVSQNINFKSVTIRTDLITDNSESKIALKKKKHTYSKKNEIKKVPKKKTKEEHDADEQRRSQYRKEVKALNESSGIKEMLAELKKNESEQKKEKIRKASTQEACLSYLKAMNKIMREDDERYKPTDYGTIESLKSTKQSLVSIKKATTYANKYKKHNCRRFVDTKPEKIQSPQKKYSRIIMSNCQKKWDTDYNMVKYCVNKQTKAYRSLSYLPEDNIMKHCRSKWDTDYNMVKYCYDKQANAKRSLGL